jgi:hypothetical protein
MAPHNPEIKPLFTVTHYYKQDRILYLKGDILEGQLKGNKFYVEYEKIVYNDFLLGDNDESNIYFKYDKNYYHLSCWYGKDFLELSNSSIQDILNKCEPLTNNFEDGAFRYGKYMNEVAYIIMTGLLVTGI